MPFRILHTADWHLGHTFAGSERSYEQRRFLTWLVETIAQHKVDLLIVAGDVYDSVNPSATASLLFFEFARELHLKAPACRTLIIAGNHDSPARLEAPQSVLTDYGFTVVSDVRWNAKGLLLNEFPLHYTGADGTTVRVYPLPFMRPSDLPPGVKPEDGTAFLTSLYEPDSETHEGPPRVAVGHFSAAGSVFSKSERPTWVDAESGVSLTPIAERYCYVALGHIHLAQGVGAEHVRYSGSPYPMSFAEHLYQHEVRLVEVDTHIAKHRPLYVPRAQQVVRIPAAGYASLLDGLNELKAWVETIADAGSAEPAPWLEAAFELDSAVPGLRADLEKILSGHAKLTKLVTRLRESEGTTDTQRPSEYSEDPRTLFESKFVEDVGATPSALVIDRFSRAWATAAETNKRKP